MLVLAARTSHDSGIRSRFASGRLAALGADTRDRALWSLRELPDEIGLLTSRTVVPVMLALRVRRPLNMLNAEALAVALLTGGVVVVTTDAPLLRSGADDLGVSYQLTK